MSTEKAPLLQSSGNTRLPPTRQRSRRPSNVNLSAATKRCIYFAAGCILLTEFFERITFNSVSGNLVLFCTNDLKYTSTAAVTISLVFTGLCYIIPLIGGHIADTISGRFNTMYAFLLVYLVGIFLMPAVALDYANIFGHDADGLKYGLPMDVKRGYFLVGIVLIAVGVGGMKSNISPLGAQQVEPLGQDAVHSFFSWFYWFMSAGGIVAFCTVVYVEQEIGFSFGYFISALALVVAIISFLAPRNFYVEHRKNSAVGYVMRILADGCCRRPATRPDGIQPTRFLDHTKASHGGLFVDSEVDEAQSLLATVPVFLTMILFQTFTSQNSTTMLLQGERLNARFGDFMLPVASLNVVKMAVVTLLIPLLDHAVYPLLERWNRKPSLLQRIGFGFVMGVVSLLCMSVLEAYRKWNISVTGGVAQNVGGIVFNASTINILWQTPQFALIGAAEAFTNVAILEFAYTESPVYMQGMVMGANHLMTGLGNLLGSAIFNIVATATADGTPWLPNDINDGHLEFYVLLLAGLLFLNLITFIFLARRYHYSELGLHPPPIPPATGDDTDGSAAPTENYDSGLDVSVKLDATCIAAAIVT